MKNTGNVTNTPPKNIPIAERPIQKSQAFQEAQFTDKFLCTKAQKNLTPLKPNKRVVEFARKQKFSQIVYSLKSSDFFTKIQQQKRQALKAQWTNMKKIQDKNEKNTTKQAKMPSNISISFNENSQTIGKLNSSELKCCGMTQEISMKQIQLKKPQKRQRSITQMLIYQYELEKIGSLKMSQSFYHQASNGKNLQIQSRDNAIDSKNQIIVNQFNQKNAIKSQPKQKTYSQQMRQATQMKFLTSLNQNHNDKKKRQIHVIEDHEEEKMAHCLSRSRNPISKTVMVQKIINLRKTFNDKYKIAPKKSFIQGQIPTSYNKSKQVAPQPDATGKLMIPYVSFPVMQHKVSRKLTFQELFNNEKKKMELLKRYIGQGGVFNNSFGDRSNDCQTDVLSSQNSNLMNLIEASHSKSLIISDHMEEQARINYINHGKNLCKGKARWSDLEKEQIKTIKSRSRILPQDFLNIQSVPISDPSKTLENDLTEQFHHPIQSPQRHVMTYEFESMNKNLQRPQIKEIRHKYLYSSKRKLSKEEFNKYGISMVQVYSRDQNNLRKLKMKCKTEMIMEECLQIEKKVPQNWDKMGKTSANFIRMKLERKKAASLEEKNRFQQKQIAKKGPNFEPWQSQVQFQFCGQEITQFPDRPQQ